MTLPPLTVIEASAGTGKTFSLVTRLLQLIFNGVEPEYIVALTFSRMAAGEIFNSFIERLANAAGDGETAAEEAERLGLKLGVRDFREMLRKVIAHQHMSLIGTLDSFLMRIIRMIPLELGLGGEVTVLSDYRSPVECTRLVGEMLMLASDDSKAVFREAFRLVFDGIGARSFGKSFSDFITNWHTRYRDCPDVAAWGDAARIWGADVPDGLGVTLAEIRALADGLKEKYAGQRGADTFISAVAEFGGSLPERIPQCMKRVNEPLAADAMRKMKLWAVARELKATQGVFRLMCAFEAAYAEKVRRRGLITFEDMPRLLTGLEEGVRLPLEYRMDARFDHWALDEFQDTSRGQWNALRNLIYENSQPNAEKSVFIVGDRKQSIYEWRGGDVRILGEQVARAAKEENRLEALNESWRYLPAISAAVNRVFGESAVRGLFDMDTAPDSAKWTCAEHVSHNRDGGGFVEVIQATKAGNQAKMSDFFAPVENALKAVKPWERGITTAILVRKNEMGEMLLAHLKANGVDKVVFEGDSSIADSPVLAAMTELVKLAEHADDAYAYAHIRHSPLRQALYPRGLPEPNALSAELLADFTRLGLVRKLRDVREALKKVPESWNGFTESRFEDLIKCAAEFEGIRDAATRLSDFVDFLGHRMRRDYAEPGMVRIMTMHQSKGLGFDHVIIPFYESENLTGWRHVGPLESEDPLWLLSNPGTRADDVDSVLDAAERRRQQIARYNSLCLCYVAMTRAKKALTVILHPANRQPPKSEGDLPPPERFSDLVRRVGLATTGDREWYLKCPATPAPATARQTPRAVVRGRRQAVVRSRPSESFYSGLSADRLFDADFGAAARRGTEIHARFQTIGWATEAELRSLPEAFHEAFRKPLDDATVWRERSYELFVGGQWETGQVDRVVFRGAGESRSATVYDFKTNAKRAKESDEAFVRRMRESYAGQMAAYRAAIGKLTGLPPSRIKAKLLLLATGMAVEMT